MACLGRFAYVCGVSGSVRQCASPQHMLPDLSPRPPHHLADANALGELLGADHQPNWKIVQVDRQRRRCPPSWAGHGYTARWSAGLSTRRYSA